MIKSERVGMPDYTYKNNYDDVDVGRVVAKIKEELNKTRQHVAHEQSQDLQEAVRDDVTVIFDASTIRSIVANAEANADAGAEVTPMVEFKGVVRKLAIIVGKVVVFLASFITAKQRLFNATTTNALKAITNGVEDLNREHNRILSNAKHQLKQEHETLKQKQEALRLEQEALRLEQETFRKGQADFKQDTLDFRKEISHFSEEMRGYKLGLLNQQMSLGMLIEVAKQRLPESFDKEQLISLTQEKDHLLDAMYVVFENKFRGTREDIKNRQEVYLPYIEKVNAGTVDTPILDVGCGRGEWLELLKENGYIAKGIDLNRVMIEQCRELGYEVIEAEVLEYLLKQEANSFKVITGFHIIEHLPHQILIDLFDQCFRVLQPGGMIVFETPNPENLVVGACNFYYDPTHRNPLPPDLTRFIAEQRGFENIEILRLHKEKEPEYTGQKSLDEIIQKMNIERDYSVIGFKV